MAPVGGRFHRRASGLSTKAGLRLEELKEVLVQELCGALAALRAVSKVDQPSAGRYPFGEEAAEAYERGWAKLPAYMDLRIRRLELGMDDAADKREPSIVYSITAETISGPIQQGSYGSTQTVVVSGDVLLSEMETTIRNEIVDTTLQAQLVDLIRELQAKKGTPEFVGAYQRFVAAAANHVTVLAPFLPALAQMLSS